MKKFQILFSDRLYWDFEIDGRKSCIGDAYFNFQFSEYTKEKYCYFTKLTIPKNITVGIFHTVEVAVD